jgi:hypothetical protein
MHKAIWDASEGDFDASTTSALALSARGYGGEGRVDCQVLADYEPTRSRSRAALTCGIAGAPTALVRTQLLPSPPRPPIRSLTALVPILLPIRIPDRVMYHRAQVLRSRTAFFSRSSKAVAMIARWVRVVENGKPNGWCGLVLAESRRELCGGPSAESFVDPYAVEAGAGHSRRGVRPRRVYATAARRPRQALPRDGSLRPGTQSAMCLH